MEHAFLERQRELTRAFCSPRAREPLSVTRTIIFCRYYASFHKIRSHIERRRVRFENERERVRGRERERERGGGINANTAISMIS